MTKEYLKVTFDGKSISNSCKNMLYIQCQKNNWRGSPKYTRLCLFTLHIFYFCKNLDTSKFPSNKYYLTIFVFFVKYTIVSPSYLLVIIKNCVIKMLMGQLMVFCWLFQHHWWKAMLYCTRVFHSTRYVLGWR